MRQPSLWARAVLLVLCLALGPAFVPGCAGRNGGLGPPTGATPPASATPLAGATPPTLEYFYHYGSFILAEGVVGDVPWTEPVLDLHFSHPVDEGAVRARLAVNPASALASMAVLEPEGRVLVYLRSLRAGEQITVTVKAGLAAEGMAPLARDHTWTVRGVKPTTVTFSALAPDMVTYEVDRLDRDNGPDSDSLFVVMPPGSLTLDIRFSRPMDRTAVAARLAQHFEYWAENIQVKWPDPTHAVASVTMARTGDMDASLHFSGIADDRGLPVVQSPAVELEVSDWRPLYRWTPGGGNLPLGRVLASLHPIPGQGVAGPGGLLLRHRPPTGADFGFHAPWVVALVQEPGAWPPVRLYTVPEPVQGRAAILGMAVNSGGDRIAAFVARENADPPPGGPVDLIVLDLEGRVRARLPEVSQLIQVDSWWPIRAFWLPDGRLASERHDGGETAANTPRRLLALADPRAGTVQVSGVPLQALHDVDPQGRLLLDGGRLYDPNSGTVTTLSLPPESETWWESEAHAMLSPDGAWLALDYGPPVTAGVLEVTSGRWVAPGPGRVAGWAPDGTLYWIGGGDGGRD